MKAWKRHSSASHQVFVYTAAEKTRTVNRGGALGSAESLCNTSTNKYRHAKIIVRSDQSMRITFDVPVDERNVVGGGREPAWAAVKSTMMFWSVSEGLGKTREASQNSVNRKEER
ncbi:hypothetical protein H634G_07124 [Metarhizium anisopliae BRIP 53293]|uniref:Uncharacterized protein n=1 Tax=Metarhizium anisopliae BRIP 53293 TaxID=1291518 RepID=A0A0D9NXR9_METAN|nr:hypothetical protein H634G_07124 [Metarhizium anisopliae BRIP 53293]KJK86394.1 hypothetical protein H633G_09752 [Metarhizium anisopliae BRIP 53284]